jgi:hypothetical protein
MIEGSRKDKIANEALSLSYANRFDFGDVPAEERVSLARMHARREIDQIAVHLSRQFDISARDICAAIDPLIQAAWLAALERARPPQ